MPKNWPNDRSRRLWFQMTIWLVFAASLGVAAVAGRVRGTSFAVKLSEVRRVGPVEFPVPMGWRVDEESAGALELREGDDAFDRHLGVRVDRGSLVDVLAMLLRGDAGEQGKTVLNEAIKVGDFPGRFRVQQFALRGQGSDRIFVYDVIASAAIGGGQTVSITMSFLGDARDLSEQKDLVRRIAAGVKVVPEGSPAGGPTTKTGS